jgi:hypothetical protein
VSVGRVDMFKGIGFSWFVALGVLAVAPTSVLASDKPSWCKGKKDCVLKGGKWVANTAAGEAFIDGAVRVGKKAKDVVNQERRCANTQGGNNANSTAAVRAC